MSTTRNLSFTLGALALCLAGVAQAGRVHPDADEMMPTGRGWGERAELPGTAPRAASHASANANGIVYHGGPVMNAATGTNVYYIWYGNWAGNSAPTILTDFMNGLGGSPWYNINTTYSDSKNVPVVNKVTLAGQATDAYSKGKALTDANIFTVVTSAITAGKVPLDANALYFVLTSADVNATSGFCTRYCGWHTYGTYNKVSVKYSFVGDSTRCPNACMAQTTGPNGNAGADGMASVIAHELAEAVTDPQLNAWYDANGAENADKCAWRFGTTYKVANTAYANVRLGTRDFLLQQNWVNAAGGSCALSY